MWAIAIIVGILIAYFILKFSGPTKTTSYIPGISYYMSELKLTGSPLEEEDSLVGVGLATRAKPSVMDSTSLSPAEMVIMGSRGSPMMEDEAVMEEAEDMMEEDEAVMEEDEDMMEEAEDMMEDDEAVMEEDEDMMEEDEDMMVDEAVMEEDEAVMEEED